MQPMVLVPAHGGSEQVVRMIEPRVKAKLDEYARTGKEGELKKVLRDFLQPRGSNYATILVLLQEISPDTTHLYTTRAKLVRNYLDGQANYYIPLSRAPADPTQATQMLPRTTIEWSIRTSNAMRGIKTEITKGTLLTYRTSGIILILLGLLLP